MNLKGSILSMFLKWLQQQRKPPGYWESPKPPCGGRENYMDYNAPHHFILKCLSFHIEKVQAIQKKNSVFNHYNINFGGAIVRNDINTLHDDQNIETHYYGLYLAHGKQHVDNHTFIDHAKPNCMSNELYKGILDDNSRGVFNGKIIVRKDAQKTNAYQQNKTILLSKSATIDTKPQLEIFADDVKCSHGATVGHLDDTSEFYIRSRGVPQELAKSMLIRAFANDVIDTVKIEPLKEQINHMIFEHLHRVEIENEQ